MSHLNRHLTAKQERPLLFIAASLSPQERYKARFSLQDTWAEDSKHFRVPRRVALKK